MTVEPTADPKCPGAFYDRGAPSSLVVGLLGFVTLVDLFAAQAILPTLAKSYDAPPSAIGFAVNASTIGMAIASLAVALFIRQGNARTGIALCLASLSIPTLLLAVAPSLAMFMALRVVQGLLMATAFALTMTYLSETQGAQGVARALAAYVTGVVASNLFGRMIAAAVTDMFDLATGFTLFAALNLAGAVLVLASFDHVAPMPTPPGARSPITAVRLHLGDPAMRAAFGIGFFVLFAFIGVFTYVNFVLVRPPLAIGAMSLGAAYLVFLPSMLTTPAAGRIAVRLGAKHAIWLGLAVALAGLPLLLANRLELVLSGMTMIGVGTFFAQAVATGYVGRRAVQARAAASGLYLASYYAGGLVGAWLIGFAFDAWGWTACVAAVGIALATTAALTGALTERTDTSLDALVNAGQLSSRHP